ncbi:EF-hand domain-containing protein [Alteraurantiacibacter buctensis]|uniref:EF-hand domain-containing protein n=1 Tax=Alteraurantiacibacter buctensis TaxID=1503981 RepID=A0A844YYK1_9SPHN|nr:EF-hand domain-containing protein [Alteraurantiacibacter buctensis]MXO71861.1 hypothetical protein [Alteraurantiacibacter buctensis]
MKTLFTLTLVTLAVAVAPIAQAQDGSRMMEQMAKADSNRDGNVSKAEFLTYRAQQFDRLDRDDNGVLSDSDLPRMARIAEMIRQHTAAMDADGNGVVTRSEFANGPTTAFDMADTNKDNVVTTSELQVARATLEDMAKKR